MFTYRTGTTQSVRRASVIFIITHIIKSRCTQNWENTTSFAHSSDVITRSLRSQPLLLLFSSTNTMNAARLFHRMPSIIYLSRSSSPSISPARSHVGTTTSPLATSQALIRSTLVHQVCHRQCRFSPKSLRVRDSTHL
jgi:hypothetical protein